MYIKQLLGFLKRALETELNDFSNEIVTLVYVRNIINTRINHVIDSMKAEEKMEKKVITSLYELSSNFPKVVFCDNLRGFLNFEIRKHTKGNYSHTMFVLDKDGKSVSQDFVGLREIDIEERYMKDGFRLKFYSVNVEEANRIIPQLLKETKLPWWKRRYDILGIVGQWFNIPAINNPKVKYCSEHVIKWLNVLLPELKIPEHLNPSQLNRLMESLPSIFTYEGHWFFD